MTTLAQFLYLTVQFCTQGLSTELKLFLVREKDFNKSLTESYIAPLDQYADILAEALSKVRFCELRDKLRVFDQFCIDTTTLSLRGKC